MNTTPRSVFLPISAAIEAIVKSPIAGLRALDPIFAEGLDLANRIQLDKIVTRLAANAVSIFEARSHDEFCDAMRQWGQSLIDLAALVLAPLAAAGVVGAELVMPFAVNLLRKKFPRIVAVLSLAGVIVDHPTQGARIDWEALRDFLVDPTALIGEKFWDDLYADQASESTGRMPAILLALLLLAPDTVMALRRGTIRIATLEPPPVDDGAAKAWRLLRARSSGWVPITFPLRAQSDGRLVLANPVDLRGGFSPEVAISLLIRSRRRIAGGRNITDFEMWIQPSRDANFHEIGSGSGLAVRLEPGVRTGFGYDGALRTWNAAVRARAGPPFNEATLSIGHEGASGAPDLIFGPPYDTRIVAQDIGATVRMREQGEPSIEVVGKVKGFGIVLTNRWFRSLGETNDSLREGLRFDLDLEMRVSEGSGFNFGADGGLAFRWNCDKRIDLNVLQLRIHSIAFSLPIRASKEHFDMRAEIRPHWSATIGPVTVVVDGAGGWVGWWADMPGSDKQCVGLLPPTGAGLQLDLRAITVGGFLDFTGDANDRYAGVVTVMLKGPGRGSALSVTGFGIHELTGSASAVNRSRSMIVVLGATFSPGIQLGWGISIVGVGGIVGINRRADTDALRERLTAGAIGNILFADDPIRNAPALLGDLDAIFPAQAGVHVVGITCQLAWLDLLGDALVRVAVGIIIELPGPSKVIVLGSARIKVPRFESLLDLEIDVAGVADLVRHTFELDATIRRGGLFKIFQVTGDAAIRASWGEPSYLMATLGGFHPNFHPEPATFPDLAPILFTIDRSLLPDAISLSGDGYLALTTNTIQFGVEFTAAVHAGNWNIQGKIGGDALIERPFFFDVSLYGSVGVRWKSHTLAGVTFNGGLSGPSPLVLRGEVCIELLLCDVCWGDSWELNNSDMPAPPVVASLVPVLAMEMESIANLSTADGADSLVHIVKRDIGDRVVVSPLGTLAWVQRRIPLGLPVTTFEGGRLATPQRLMVQVSVSSIPILDWFSPGTYVELSDAEEMALPAFERHQSGFAVSLEELRSPATTTSVGITEIRLPLPPRIGGAVIVPQVVLVGMAGRSSAVSFPPSRPRFAVDDDRFSVVESSGAVAVDGLTAVRAHTLATARGMLVQHSTDQLIPDVA